MRSRDRWYDASHTTDELISAPYHWQKLGVKQKFVATASGTNNVCKFLRYSMN